ncbi:MAG: heavy metal translocating P-type ATPase [Bacilli bacterium]|nr:heavy metal translocating P-type ATPase [Bacilli bacterium]
MRYYIKGLDCPHCAEALEKYIQENKNVKYAKLNFTKGYLDLKLYDDAKFDEVYKYILKMEKVTLSKKEKNYTLDIKTIILMFVSLVFFILANVFNSLYLYIIAYVVVGYEVLFKAFKNIIRGKIFDERFLMSIASIGAFVIKEYNEAVLVMLLYTFGEFLQDLAIEKSRNQIKNLVDFKVENCDVVKGNVIINKDVNDVEIGDIIAVKLGEKVAIDGILLSDYATFNTQSLTGESKLYELSKNDEVLSGYVNEGDVIYVKTTKNYQDSTLKRILDMIENATENKATSETFITKFSKYYTPIVVLLAVVIGFVSFFAFNQTINASVTSSLVFLVVSCPCALILSIPLLYFAAIGRLSSYGILLKGSSYFEEINKVKEIVFDKTGTLTKGEFKVSEYSSIETLNIAANLEKYSLHPLAKSIAKNIKTPLEVEDFKEIKSRGVKGIINNQEYYFGNANLLKELGINVEKSDNILYLVNNKFIIGYITLEDEIKKDVKETLASLKQYNLVLLSGDDEQVVKDVATKLNIKEYYANKLPIEKAEIVKHKQNVMYVGDGVNDSLSLVNANVGVAMGLKGADSSIEVANVVLSKDNIASLNDLFKVSKKTSRIARFNIVFILTFKLLFLILGSLNLINMSLAVFADVGIALLMVLSSLRILK